MFKWIGLSTTLKFQQISTKALASSMLILLEISTYVKSLGFFRAQILPISIKALTSSLLHFLFKPHFLRKGQWVPGTSSTGIVIRKKLAKFSCKGKLDDKARKSMGQSWVVDNECGEMFISIYYYCSYAFFCIQRYLWQLKVINRPNFIHLKSWILVEFNISSEKMF